MYSRSLHKGLAQKVYKGSEKNLYNEQANKGQMYYNSWLRANIYKSWKYQI